LKYRAVIIQINKFQGVSTHLCCNSIAITNTGNYSDRPVRFRGKENIFTNRMITKSSNTSVACDALA